MSERWEEELALLREHYPDLEYVEHGGEHWCRLPAYGVSGGKFRPDEVEVAFRIPPRPADPPYAFWVRPGVEAANGATIQNYGHLATTAWGSDWGQFSWAPEEEWRPKADVRKAPNMLTYVRSFADRFEEGP